jgi:hypothetical protein
VLVEPALENHLRRDRMIVVAGAPLDESELFHTRWQLAVFDSSPNEGGGAMVTVRNPCLELVALASEERLKAPVLSGRVPGGILGVMKKDDAYLASPYGYLASPYGGAFAAADDEDVWGGLSSAGPIRTWGTAVH